MDNSRANGNMVLGGQYELLNEIGSGGSSTVFFARDLNIHGKFWAVKRVSQYDIERFVSLKKEVQLLTSLNHSDIPRIVQQFEIDEYYYIVMDLLDGVSLKEKVAREGALPEESVVEWAKTLCDILSYLHTAYLSGSAKNESESLTNDSLTGIHAPIIYRDMKPENVMYIEFGNSSRVKLIDFGIAKECTRGVPEQEIMGTPGYAAPEQFSDGSHLIDERTDIFSLGMTLYYIVTGQKPSPIIGARSATSPIRRINPLLSEGLEYIIQRCTRIRPEERYQSCAELMTDLNNIEQLSGAYKRRMKNSIVTCAVSLGLAFIFAGFSLWGYLGLKRENADNYQIAVQQALDYQREAVTAEKAGDYAQAESLLADAGVSYRKAIALDGTNVDDYLRLLDVLSPRNNDDYISGTRVAVDLIRAYVDKPSSPVYHNVTLMYQLAARSVDISESEPVYAQYASEYLSLIQQSKEYASGSINKNEIDSLKLISDCVSTDVNTLVTTDFAKALETLEREVGYSSSAADKKLSTYYSLMQIYDRYSGSLEDAYKKITDLGGRAKSIIDEQSESESLTFNAIVPLYTLAAESCYESAVSYGSSGQSEDDYNILYSKRSAYESCLTWFSYLDELGADISEDNRLKRANACKGIFDTYNTSTNQQYLTDDNKEFLTRAIEMYRAILSAYPNNLSAQINLTSACITKQLILPVEARSLAEAQAELDTLLHLREGGSSNMSIYQLSKISAVRQEAIMLGLEVGE